MQFDKDFYENWNAHNHTTSQNDDDDDQHNGFPKMKDPNRRKTRGGGGASPLQQKKQRNEQQLGTSDEEEYSVYERQHQIHLNQQSRKLLEAGLNIDHTYSNNDTTYKYAQLMGKTEDLNRELSHIQQAVQNKIKTKIQGEQEAMDKQKSDENLRRQKLKE